MRNTPIRTGTTTLMLLLLISCDGSTLADLGALVDSYVANFSNQWTVEKGKPDGPFFFIASDIDSTKGTGKLEATDQSSFPTFKLVGSFDNLKVEIRYLTDEERDAIDGGNDGNGEFAGTAYSGRLDTLQNPILMRLANVADKTDSLVLRQGP